MTIKTHKTTASSFEADLGYCSASIKQCRKARGYILKLSDLTALIVTGFISISSQAALHDRGNGLTYDDVNNITWLSDANYAMTSGHDTDGLMSWEAANTWANNLSYGGYNDWRLPSANLLNAANPCHAANGDCDEGYNNTNSEMGYMFHENLGFSSLFDENYSYQLDSGVQSNTYNLQAGVYWFSEEDINRSGFAWIYDTQFGSQSFDRKTNEYYSWAVRDGDVSPAIDDDISAVPIPSAVWLFGSALIGLAGINRRQRKQ